MSSLQLNQFSLFPSPLYTPDKWPSPGVWDSVWLLPLDVACFAGGPLKTYFELIQKKSTFAWYVPRGFLVGDVQPIDLSLRQQAAEELILQSPGKGFVFESETTEEFQKLFPNFIGASVLAIGRADLAHSIGDWAQAVFSTFWQALGDDRATELVELYVREFPEAVNFPWEGLRFFAGFVRRHDPALTSAAELAARDWAKFQALFSPQNEKSEKASLRKNQVMLNPTAQILRRHQGTPSDQDMSVMVRKGSVVSEVSLGWMDAALIDGVNEEARVERAKLLAMVEVDHGGSFAPALDKLIANEILFEGL